MSPELFALLVAAAILVGAIAVAVLILVFSQTRQTQRISRRLDPERHHTDAELSLIHISEPTRPY